MKAETKELADVICEFLEVAVHLILHVRSLYPAEVFERRRYATVPVQWARHPELQEYIHTAVLSLHDWLMLGLVQKVAVVLRNESSAASEKFVIQIGPLSIEPLGSAPAHELEEPLRSILMKLSALEPAPESNQGDKSWELVAYTSQPPAGIATENVAWVSVDDVDVAETPVITPIRSVKKGPLQLQVYIEQPG